EHSTTKFDLTFFVGSDTRGLHNGVEYNTDLFEPETIQRLLEHWQILLEGIVAEPQQRLFDLPLLTEAERQSLLVEWNNIQPGETSERCLHELVEEQARWRADAVALVYEDEYLTYEQLDGRANQLAHLLGRLGVGPESIVGLAVECSLLLGIGLLGILKAGGAYLPLDPSYPLERLVFML